jgi:hypothetical protein
MHSYGASIDLRKTANSASVPVVVKTFQTYVDLLSLPCLLPHTRSSSPSRAEPFLGQSAMSPFLSSPVTPCAVNPFFYSDAMAGHHPPSHLTTLSSVRFNAARATPLSAYKRAQPPQDWTTQPSPPFPIHPTTGRRAGATCYVRTHAYQQTYSSSPGRDRSITPAAYVLRSSISRLPTT